MATTKRTTLVTGLLVGVFALPPALAQEVPAPDKNARDNPLQGTELNDAQRAAVERGLAWLAARQQADGNFGGMGGGAQAAVTAVSAISMMAAGNLPGRGKYGANVAKAVDAIIAGAQPNGLLADANSGGGTMYAHGFAALFLGEVYGMTGDERVKEPLTRAIRLIQKTQNPEGGWRYTPAPVDADISVTICQVMALRAARDAGIKVEKDVIDKAVKYVKGLQNPDGGFNYMASGGNNSMFPRSAAGVATLYYAGESGGKPIDSGLAYIERFRPGRAGANADSINGHYFYGHYYAAQAMFLAGGEHWAKWYPAVRDELVARQSPDGSWNGEVTGEYCTAMALIVLQMPNRYLPVFSGKGTGS